MDILFMLLSSKVSVGTLECELNMILFLKWGLHTVPVGGELWGLHTVPVGGELWGLHTVPVGGELKQIW